MAKINGSEAPEAITKIQLLTKTSIAEITPLDSIQLDLGEPLVNTNDKTLIIGTGANKAANDDSSIVLGDSRDDIAQNDEETSTGNPGITITHYDGNKERYTRTVKGRWSELTSDNSGNIIIDSTPALEIVGNNNTVKVSIAGPNNTKDYSESIDFSITGNGIGVSKSENSNEIVIDPSDISVKNLNSSDLAPIQVNSPLTIKDSDLTVSEKSNIKIGKDKLFDLIYPVGSIYISVNNTNPANLFGGTWTSFGQGKTLIGCGSSTYSEVESTGGSETVTLTENELPEHTHELTEHTHSMTHSHEFTGTKKELSVDLNKNIKITGETQLDGSHRHNVLYKDGGSVKNQEHSVQYSADPGSDGEYNIPTSESINHRHGIELDISVDISHTHTFTPEGTINEYIKTTGSAKGVLSATGAGNKFSIIQPYITVYMWKRTA